MSGYVSGGPMYYNEIVADPKQADRVYSMDVYMQVTEDGGRTFRNAGERWKHVDNHALWIDPADTRHLVNGSDGGVYESYDRGYTWEFKANLPITQFYRVEVDNSTPFYYVYGGTQDNCSLGGPSRTATTHGITNDLWFVTATGRRLRQPRGPAGPQHRLRGIAARRRRPLRPAHRRAGRHPAAGRQGRPAAPLELGLAAHHQPAPPHPALLRRAAGLPIDDRGDSWTPVSGDLTRQIDRNALKVMGRVWSVDAVAKNTSTSFYGNIVSLAESPVKEGLLYVGTDDGLVQVTEDGGKTWRRIEKFPGVPDNSYVSRLEPSPRDADTVYAAFDNHKMGDFKPYLLKSTDRGRTGRRSPATCRSAARSTSSSRIPRRRPCCSPAPSSACSSPSMAGRHG